MDSKRRRKRELRLETKIPQRRKKKRKKQRWIRFIVLVVLLCGCFLGGVYVGKKQERMISESDIPKVEIPPEFQVQLLTINPFSRPGISMDKIKGIVIHYVANPMTTAQQNRDYFEGLKDTGTTKASSHFIVGIQGEIIQCIPSSEIAYASNERNSDTIAIECCHVDETGEFSKETYKSLVHLTAWLCGKFNLQPEDVIRHYDVTGKPCPLYYVEHEEEWTKFIQDVTKYIENF